MAGARSRGGALLLWFAVLGGAAAWTAHLLVSFELETIACSPASGGARVFGAGLTAAVAVVTVVLAAVAAAAGWVAWRFARRLARARRGRAGHGEAAAEPRAGRAEFMALVGLAGDLLFLLIIVYGGISLAVLHPCTT